MAGTASDLPPSATHAAVAWCGLLAMLAGVTLLNFWSPVHDIAYQALIVMTCAGLGVFLPDLLWQRVQARALRAAPAAANWPRVITKLAGLLASVGPIGLAYWLFPEYERDSGFYHHYWAALRILLPAWALLA